MTPEEFIKKMQDGSLSEAEASAFVTSLQTQLSELKQRDPAAYLKTVHQLTEAMAELNDAIELTL